MIPEPARTSNRAGDVVYYAIICISINYAIRCISTVLRGRRVPAGARYRASTAGSRNAGAWAGVVTGNRVPRRSAARTPAGVAPGAALPREPAGAALCPPLLLRGWLGRGR